MQLHQFSPHTERCLTCGLSMRVFREQQYAQPDKLLRACWPPGLLGEIAGQGLVRVPIGVVWISARHFRHGLGGKLLCECQHVPIGKLASFGPVKAMAITHISSHRISPRCIFFCGQCHDCGLVHCALLARR